MTPLQIRMMLHYYAIAERYAKGDALHANSTAVHEQRNSLIEMQLLEADQEGPSGYRVTARGLAYVEALCAMSLPIMRWIVPASRNEEIAYAPHR